MTLRFPHLGKSSDPVPFLWLLSYVCAQVDEQDSNGANG